MDEPNRSEPIAERSFGTTLYGRRVPDDIAGYYQDDNTQGIDPMVKPDRKFPDIFLPHDKSVISNNSHGTSY
jgi:hypothetical protein